ncbi:hypothetical protein HOY80DRAFT_991169 [Tuber brumale]|nr:hypothetical protein HOY80DRAFT_991169 [Tuber brumale]
MSFFSLLILSLIFLFFPESLLYKRSCRSFVFLFSVHYSNPHAYFLCSLDHINLSILLALWSVLFVAPEYKYYKHNRYSDAPHHKQHNTPHPI